MTEDNPFEPTVAEWSTATLAGVLGDQELWDAARFGPTLRAIAAEAAQRLLELDCKVNLHGLGA